MLGGKEEYAAIESRKWNKSRRGFTLVEIIVVLVILAILAAFTIPTMLGFVNDAKGKAYIPLAREIYEAGQIAATETFGSSVGGETYTADQVNGRYPLNDAKDAMAQMIVDKTGQDTGLTGIMQQKGNTYSALKENQVEIGIKYTENKNKLDTARSNFKTKGTAKVWIDSTTTTNNSGKTVYTIDYQVKEVWYVDPNGNYRIVIKPGSTAEVQRIK